MVDPEEFSGVEDLPILMDDVKCRGMESNLLSCPQLQLNASHDCTHMEDVAISCTGTRRCQNGEIALAGGQYVSEGTIQICLDGVWGTVCDDLWDPTDAGVVCNILGYTNGSAIALRGAHFGQGTGPIHLDNVICTGSETSLLDCRSSPHNCGHYEDAGVICPAPQDADANCTNGDIRLADGDNEYQGRVEVCLHGNWGTVCDDGWDNRDAGVVCNQLGYTGGFPSAVSNAGFGRGSGLIFLDNVDCDGTEPNLLQCRGNEPGNHNCGPSEDAGVFCPARPCIDGTLRLNDGFNPSNGRLEICVNEVWATVCGTGFTDEMAAAACTGMGLPSDGAFRSAEGLFGSPSSEGPFYVVDIQCPPARPTNCTFTTATPPGTCTHENDVGVFCPVAEGTPTLCTTGDIRLAGTFRPQQGRVEICINNQWGTICDDSWNQHSVNFVCTSLYDQSIVGEMVDPEEFSGGEDLPILMDDVKCRGTESNLLSCPQLQLNASHDCTHMEDVAISCNGTRRCRDGEIMLAGGQYESEGTIQICIDDVWGTVCDDLWDQTDAGVVCNVLGYTNGSAIALRGAHFGEGTGPIHLDNVICTGSENSLLDCRYSPHNCGHYEDAGVICPAPQDADTNCTNGEVRLADGDNEYQGRVEVCLHGNWGTVCDDRWDNRDARVVCNQLGYTGGVPFSVTRAGFGRGSGLIFLDNVDCDGTEPNLLQCRGNEPGNHNCGPSEDAGVYCP
ncbi:Deleted in malignant brain tumors 1 protein, partial [Geodia barretti]